MTKDLECSIRVSVPIENAFDAVTRVNEWWTENFTGSSADKDDEFTVTFGETFMTMKLTSANRPNAITWKVTDCYLSWFKDKYEWQNTDVVWELSSHNGSTEITLTHIGITPEVECYDSCVEGWTFYVTESLFKLMTEGKGLPHR